MHKPLRLLLAAVAVSVTLFAGVRPAPAHTDVCAGSFVMGLNQGFGTVLTYPSKSTSFGIAGPASVCGFSQFTASGSISGNCFSATGLGRTGFGSGNHTFTFAWTGNTARFDGQLKGVLHVDDYTLLTLYSNCGSGTARHLVLTGTLVLAH